MISRELEGLSVKLKKCQIWTREALVHSILINEVKDMKSDVLQTLKLG